MKSSTVEAWRTHSDDQTANFTTTLQIMIAGDNMGPPSQELPTSIVDGGFGAVVIVVVEW